MSVAQQTLHDVTSDHVYFLKDKACPLEYELNIEEDIENNSQIENDYLNCYQHFDHEYAHTSTEQTPPPSLCTSAENSGELKAFVRKRRLKQAQNTKQLGIVDFPNKGPGESLLKPEIKNPLDLKSLPVTPQIGIDVDRNGAPLTPATFVCGKTRKTSQSVRPVLSPIGNTNTLLGSEHDKLDADIQHEVKKDLQMNNSLRNGTPLLLDGDHMYSLKLLNTIDSPSRDTSIQKPDEAPETHSPYSEYNHIAMLEDVTEAGEPGRNTPFIKSVENSDDQMHMETEELKALLENASLHPVQFSSSAPCINTATIVNHTGAQTFSLPDNSAQVTFADLATCFDNVQLPFGAVQLVGLIPLKGATLGYKVSPSNMAPLFVSVTNSNGMVLTQYEGNVNNVSGHSQCSNSNQSSFATPSLLEDANKKATQPIHSHSQIRNVQLSGESVRDVSRSVQDTPVNVATNSNNCKDVNASNTHSVNILATTSKQHIDMVDARGNATTDMAFKIKTESAKDLTSQPNYLASSKSDILSRIDALINENKHRLDARPVEEVVKELNSTAQTLDELRQASLRKIDSLLRLNETNVAKSAIEVSQVQAKQKSTRITEKLRQIQEKQIRDVRNADRVYQDPLSRINELLAENERNIKKPEIEVIPTKLAKEYVTAKRPLDFQRITVKDIQRKTLRNASKSRTDKKPYNDNTEKQEVPQTPGVSAVPTQTQTAPCQNNTQPRNNAHSLKESLPNSQKDGDKGHLISTDLLPPSPGLVAENDTLKQDKPTECTSSNVMDNYVPITSVEMLVLNPAACNSLPAFQDSESEGNLSASVPNKNEQSPPIKRKRSKSFSLIDLDCQNEEVTSAHALESRGVVHRKRKLQRVASEEELELENKLMQYKAEVDSVHDHAYSTNLGFHMFFRNGNTSSAKNDTSIAAPKTVTTSKSSKVPKLEKSDKTHALTYKKSSGSHVSSFNNQRGPTGTGTDPDQNTTSGLESVEESSRAIIRDHTYDDDPVNTQQFSIQQDHNYKKLKKRRTKLEQTGSLDHSYTPQP